VEWVNGVATLVVFLVLITAAVVIYRRRRRRRLARRRPWITRGELFSSVVLVVLAAAILSHTR
jgi:amino acid transporter